MLDSVSKLRAKWNNDIKRRSNVLKAKDYYINDQNEYIKEALKRTYKNSYEDIIKYIDKINLTETVINQMSIMFENPPDILPDTKEETTIEEFNELIDSAQLIPYLDKIQKYVNLTHKVGLMPHYFNDKVYLDIITGDRVYVEQNEEFPTIADSVWVQVGITQDSPHSADRIDKYIKWTAEEHQVVYINTENGGIIKAEAPKPNPYQEIPIVWFANDIEDDSFWFDCESYIVEKNEIFNIDLTALRFGTTLQSFSTLVLEGFDPTKNIKMGVHRPIVIPKRDLPEQSPGKAYYITPGSDLQKIYDIIDKRIIDFVNSMGLNAKSYRSDSSSFSSGYQLKLSRLDVIKRNVKDRQYFLKPIKDICKMMMKCYSLFNTQKRFPEDIDINVDFAEMKFDEDPMQRRQIHIIDLNNNLTSVPRILQEDNPDLSLEDAKELAEKIKQENQGTVNVEQDDTELDMLIEGNEE